MPSRVRFGLVIILAALVLAGCLAIIAQAAAAQTAPRAADTGAPTAEQRLEALLTAMGGRERWAGVKAMRVVATHWSAGRAAPNANVIWNDFAAPKVRIEAQGGGLDRVRAIADGAGWRRDEGKPVEAMTAEAVKDDADWWEGNVYRTLHRLAARDPALSVRLGTDGILEVLRADGTRLNWYRLNRVGEPIQFGTGEIAAGTVFGPLAEGPGGVRYPRWGARPDGTWRYEIREIATYAGPPPVSFAPPAG